MSKSGKLIMAILIVIVIIIIIIISLLLYQKRGALVRHIDETGDEIQYSYDDTIKRVDTRNEFFAVQSCINKFYVYYQSMYNTQSSKYDVYDEGDSSDTSNVSNEKAIYDMLDEEYITSKNITENNIQKNFVKISNSVINITDVFVSERTSNMSLYIAEGTLREKRTGKISNIKVILKIDKTNRAFTILPSEYVNEKYNTISEGQKINIDVGNEIKRNQFNTYDYRNITEETYVESLKNQFKEEALYNSDLLYKRLDETYKNSKFKDINEFKEYNKNNIKKYVLMQIDAYQKDKTADYTQYALIDTNKNTYIFRETAPMHYELILDTYTIELPEFKEKYAKASDQEKVILNIDKFMQAINDKDYKYAYSLLASNFKTKNFKTLNSFEEYIKTNLFERNEFEYIEFGDEAGTYYTYTVRIVDKENNSNKSLRKTFIMLLGESSNFELSFNI